MSEPQCSNRATSPPTMAATGDTPSPKIPMLLRRIQSNTEPMIADKSAVSRRLATRPTSIETTFWLDIRNLHDTLDHWVSSKTLNRLRLGSPPMVSQVEYALPSIAQQHEEN